MISNLALLNSKRSKGSIDDRPGREHRCRVRRGDPRPDAGAHRVLGGAARRISAEGSLTVQRWEYMTWKVGDLGDAGAHVRIADGEEFARNERQPLYEALDRAGGDGWELVG